jgi:hypothetical protein
MDAKVNLTHYNFRHYVDKNYQFHFMTALPQSKMYLGPSDAQGRTLKEKSIIIYVERNANRSAHITARKILQTEFVVTKFVIL